MPRIEGQDLGRGIPEPVLTITIINGNLATQGPAVVDSGADLTVVPAGIAAVVGIDFSTLPAPTGDSRGAGGSFEARPVRAKIRWRQWDVCDAFQVAEPGSLDDVLLGREDFFKRFKVSFNWGRTPPILDVDPLAAAPTARSGKRR